MDLNELNGYGQDIMKCLKLTTSPVAVKLIPKGGSHSWRNSKSR